MDESAIDTQNSQKDALFQAAEFGNVDLTRYLLNKGLDIDSQDEGGDTVLHHAARRGYSTLVSYLLRRQASVFIKNKKDRTALLEAYENNHSEIVKKITENSLEKCSINSVVTQSFHAEKVDSRYQVDRFISECKKHIRKEYLNKGIFNRLLARHNERAKALIQALGRCTSIKEAKGLIKNQCDLFEKGAANSVSSHLLASRWSENLKNKPGNISKSSFYRVLKTMPGQKLSTGPVQNRTY